MPHAVVSSVPRTLRLLALDTSTEVLSVALGQHEGAALRHVRQHTGAGAAQSSAALIPAVLRLLSEAGWQLADLQAIVFGAGPGSFTGLRTACAVAQGLALGANVPVLPDNTLLAVAEDWRSRVAAAAAQGAVWALLDARMDEIYAACWQWQMQADGTATWRMRQGAALVSPEQVAALVAGLPCAGNVQPVYGPRLGVVVAHAMPTAQAMLRVAADLLDRGAAVDAALALPEYVRDKVAQTTAERAAQAAQP